MKPSIPEEVLVLRFFETGPIERVEPVFNIVCEKMRERSALTSQPAARAKRERPRKAESAATLPEQAESAQSKD